MVGCRLTAGFFAIERGACNVRSDFLWWFSFWSTPVLKIRLLILKCTERWEIWSTLCNFKAPGANQLILWNLINKSFCWGRKYFFLKIQHYKQKSHWMCNTANKTDPSLCCVVGSSPGIILAPKIHFFIIGAYWVGWKLWLRGLNALQSIFWFCYS